MFCTTCNYMINVKTNSLSWLGNRLSVSQLQSFNLFSNLSYDFTLYKTWQASINWQGKLSWVSTGYCLSTINKNIHYKRASYDQDNNFQFSYKFFIPEIQKLAFHVPHVQILGMNHCGDSIRTVFKHRKSFQYVLCCHGYSERLFAIFANQIQSEYCGGNRSVSIEGIVLEYFSVLP